MLFNSIEYILFFASVVGAYYALPHTKRWLLLLVASYVFYAWWNPGYAALILGSTLIDYRVAIAMDRSDRRARKKRLLITSLIANLGLLFTFKYWNFANDNLAAAFAAMGIPWHGGSLDLLLPVGISFYTFQTLSYTIDVYRGRLAPEKHLGHFALYVAFFPQLVAGPIERAVNLLPQLRTVKTFDWDRVASGLQLALWGLFKKVVIADLLARHVVAIYGNVPEHNGVSYWVATYAFAFQIFCDFSGYSDIAIGSARVMGFDLMKNFDRPYFATTIVDFWRRWHISLSTWLRDYLYIPLGGNRGGTVLLYRNLMITMLLGGLWHGASWNFVIWGGLQGVMLSLSRATLSTRNRLNERLGIPLWLRDSIRMVITFHLVCVSWVFFRAESLHDATHMLVGMCTDLGAPFINRTILLQAVFGIAVLLAVQVTQSRVGSVRTWMSTKPLPIRWTCWYFLLFSIVLLGVDSGTQFIYFQF